MDSQPGLISSVVYTYLSLLPFHVGPTLANLKEQEAHMCISLIRTRVSYLYIVYAGSPLCMQYHAYITVVSQKRTHYGLSAHPPVFPQFPAEV